MDPAINIVSMAFFGVLQGFSGKATNEQVMGGVESDVSRFVPLFNARNVSLFIFDSVTASNSLRKLLGNRGGVRAVGD